MSGELYEVSQKRELYEVYIKSVRNLTKFPLSDSRCPLLGKCAKFTVR